MLHPIPIPGLLITGTDTDVGKTIIAGAIADWFKRRGARVAVCKPAGSGCVKRREGLVSEDAEFLAHCANARAPLDLICPQRYEEAMAPYVAGERAKQPLDWGVIDRSIQSMCREADVMIVEGVGGILVPMDKDYLMLDVARWLKLPAVVVARANLGTINHSLLTIAALRAGQVPVAGVVINRYPPETPNPVEETNPRVIEKWGRAPILCLVPATRGKIKSRLPADIVSAINTVDWSKFAYPAK